VIWKRVLKPLKGLIERAQMQKSFIYWFTCPAVKFLKTLLCLL